MTHGHGHGAGPLTPVEEHLAQILGTVSPLAPTRLALADVHGLVLAEDVSAVAALPSFDNSGMDGYAVRVEDVAAATEENPVTLPVTGEIAAGDTGAYALAPGTSIRIMTGAMLPHGTEAVVPVELTDAGTARVTIYGRAGAGHALRLAGLQGRNRAVEADRLRPRVARRRARLPGAAARTRHAGHRCERGDVALLLPA